MSCSLYQARDSIRTSTMSYLSCVPSTLSTDPVLCPQLQALRNVLQEWMNDRITSSLNAGASGLLGVFVLSCSLLLPTPTWLSGTYLKSLNMRQEPLFFVWQHIPHSFTKLTVNLLSSWERRPRRSEGLYCNSLLLRLKYLATSGLSWGLAWRIKKLNRQEACTSTLNGLNSVLNRTWE